MACNKPNMSMVLTINSHENLDLKPSGRLIPLDPLFKTN